MTGRSAMTKPPSHKEIYGILRDPERPYPFFTGGCPAPLKLSLPGIVFTELCGACPMQAEGRANGLGFSFWACHGRWEMEIEQPGNAPARLLSGDDRWQGHMPPSVAFAMIVFKLLWHVCGRDPFYGPATGMGCTPNLDPGQPGSRSLIRSADRECLEQANLLIGELRVVIGELNALLDEILDQLEVPDGLTGIDFESAGPRVMQIFLPPGTIRDPSEMEARHPGLKIRVRE